MHLLDHVPMRSCLVYRVGNRLYVVSQHRTETGWRIAALPVLALDIRDAARAVGAATLHVLSHYRENVAQPTDVADSDDDVLRAVGVVSWDELSSRKAKLCHVEDDCGVVTVTPTAGDESGGFTPDSARSFRCAVAPDDVGQAVMSALRA